MMSFMIPASARHEAKPSAAIIYVVPIEHRKSTKLAH